mmetsp:Transcript_51766/g.123189  ORF Transcript_51766/g.123189 Transcript_51766/m.123189 type:complete len:104 (-) Transcript_51766:168-479(-)
MGCASSQEKVQETCVVTGLGGLPDPVLVSHSAFEMEPHGAEFDSVCITTLATMVRREGLQLPRRPGPPDRRLARKKQACLESIEEDPSSFRCEAVARRGQFAL